MSKMDVSRFEGQWVTFQYNPLFGPNCGVFVMYNPSVKFNETIQQDVLTGHQVYWVGDIVRGRFQSRDDYTLWEDTFGVSEMADFPSKYILTIEEAMNG